MSEFPVSSLFENPDLAPEEVAARMLVTKSALDDLTFADAAVIVTYMRPKRILAGTVFIKEGEVKQNDYMLLVLEGDIAIENDLPGHRKGDDASPFMINIIGPGHLIGEMGLLDGSPRSATCTATTDIAAAVLSRTALMRLLKDHPRTGSRLLLAISKRMADRLRETTRKLRSFAQMNRVLQEELQVVMNGRSARHRSSDSQE